MNKVAIVFWSATGNTETMANCIAEGAGAAATIVPCAEMDAAKLGGYDVVAFGCPAMGAEQLEESEFEPMFAGRRRLSERQEGGSVRLLRLGRRASGCATGASVSKRTAHSCSATRASSATRRPTTTFRLPAASWALIWPTGKK